MNENPSYKKYHPKLYRKPIPILWWTQKWVHTKFILRDITCVFVAFYAIMLMIQISAISRGSESYDAFFKWLQTPGSLILHFIAFLFLLLHSITWFSLFQKAVVLRIGNRPIPGSAITASHFFAWIVISAIIAWILIII